MGTGACTLAAQRVATAGFACAPLLRLPLSDKLVVLRAVMLGLSPDLVGGQALTRACLVGCSSGALGPGWTADVAAVWCAVFLRLAWRRFARAP